MHFLPPYCPDANRIERVWQDLHANVTRNHRCKSLKALRGGSGAGAEADQGALTGDEPVRFPRRPGVRFLRILVAAYTAPSKGR